MFSQLPVPQNNSITSWYELNSDRRSRVMAQYICDNNGPDSNGGAYLGVTAFKLAEIEQALEIAKAAGLSKDFRPYHFSNIREMKASRELTDELLLKKIEQLLNLEFKGDLHALITGITSTHLREPLRDHVAGRIIDVPTSSARKWYSDTYSALRKYLEAKGHFQELRDLRPFHLSRAAKNTFKNVNSQIEVIKLTIDHLIKFNFGTLDDLIAKVNSADLQQPVPSMINGKAAMVSPITVFIMQGSSVFKFVSKYIEVNGLATRYRELRPYHFAVAAHGTLTQEVVNTLILARGDELFEHKYHKTPKAFLAGTSYKELFAPYVDYIKGSRFEVSMKVVREYLDSSPWNFIQSYFRLKKMDAVLAELEPTGLYRLPRGISEPEKGRLYDSQIKTRIDHILGTKFNANMHSLISNITADDIRGDGRVESAFKACGSSVFGFVWRYLEITNQAEAYRDLRGYHFRSPAKGSLKQDALDEILVAKLDGVLAQEYLGDLPAMIASISVTQIASRLLQVVNGEVFRVSCKQLRETYSKFESIKRYLKLKGCEATFNDLQPYHVGALGIFDERAISDGLIKKRLDDLLIGKFKGDLAALISNISRVQIVDPFHDIIAGRQFEVSLLRLFDLPDTASTFKIVKRYLELSDQAEAARCLRPFHLTKSHDADPQDYISLLDLKCRSLVLKYGGFKPMLLNISAIDFEAPVRVSLANMELDVGFSSVFSSVFRGSPYTVVRSYCKQNSILFPYGKYCLIGPPETRLRRMEGRLSSKDRVRTLSDKGVVDTSAYGFRHFSSPGKMDVRRKIVDIAGEYATNSGIKFLGLETERFELVRLLALAHNFDAENSVIVERDPRVFNAMRSFQKVRSRGLKEISGIKIIQSDIESAIAKLEQKFNVVHLDFFGHLTPRRLRSIGQLFSANSLEPKSLLVITLGGSSLDQARGLNAGIEESPEIAISMHLKTISDFKIQHIVTSVYSGGERGKGQFMQSIFIGVDASHLVDKTR